MSWGGGMSMSRGKKGGRWWDGGFIVLGTAPLCGVMDSLEGFERRKRRTIWRLSKQPTTTNQTVNQPTAKNLTTFQTTNQPHHPPQVTRRLPGASALGPSQGTEWTHMPTPPTLSPHQQRNAGPFARPRVAALPPLGSTHQALLAMHLAMHCIQRPGR